MKNDIAYANADFILNAPAYPEGWAEAARGFREVEHTIGRARVNHAYGPGERQKLDLFHPAGRADGLVVFVHGGYWLRFDRTIWSHFAAGLTARNWAVAMPSYPLAPEASIPEIVQSVRQAIEEAATLIAGPIRLVGHSAGGHLASRMVMPDVGLNAIERVEKVVPISPISDLRPLRETSMNASLKLDAEIAAAESPALGPISPQVAATIWVGAEERPAFLDQARWLSEAWGVPYRIAPGRHHFDVLDELENPESGLVSEILS